MMFNSLKYDLQWKSERKSRLINVQGNDLYFLGVSKSVCWQIHEDVVLFHYAFMLKTQKEMHFIF